MPYDITDAKEDIQVLAAQIQDLYSILEKVDKIIVEGGKPSIMKGRKQQEQEIEDEDEDEEGTIQDLDVPKPPKKKKRKGGFLRG